MKSLQWYGPRYLIIIQFHHSIYLEVIWCMKVSCASEKPLWGRRWLGLSWRRLSGSSWMKQDTSNSKREILQATFEKRCDKICGEVLYLPKIQGAIQKHKIIYVFANSRSVMSWADLGHREVMILALLWLTGFPRCHFLFLAGKLQIQLLFLVYSSKMLYDCTGSQKQLHLTVTTGF